MLVYSLRVFVPIFGSLLLAGVIYRYFSAPILAWTKHHLARKKKNAAVAGTSASAP